MATIIIEVDERQARVALKRLNDSIDNTGKKAEKSFNKSGVSIGAVSGVVGALTEQFIQLAIVAARTFIEITKKAIDLNKEAELTRLSLIQIFEGNEKAADAFIDTIGDLAIRLGTSRQELTGLAKGILPDVGGIDATAELLENVIVLGRDAGQNIQSIRIATEEALSGNLTSLGRRLNIPKTTLDSIREYQKEMSLADAINRGLKERIEKTGISAAITADSFTTLQGKIGGAVEELQKVAGAAPFEELKEQAEAFLEIFETQGDDITRVAQAFGDLAANVIDFIGTNLTDFIESIDFEAVEELVDTFNAATDTAELLLDVIFDLDDASLFNNLIKGLDTLIGKFQELTLTAAKAETLLAARESRFKAETEVFGKAGKILGPTGAKFFADAETKALAAAAGQKAFDDTIRASLPSFEKHAKAQEENEQRTKDRRKAVEDTTEADRAAGDAIIRNKKLLEELEAAQGKAAQAQDEITKKTSKAEEDRAKSLTNLLRKEANRRLDDAIKAAQRLEDIARRNADDIEDIFRKQDQAIADAGKDLSREEQDIARNAARDRKDIEQQAANERLDIERGFRQELERIQRQFNQSALDAERNNDAQAFIQAIRAKDEQIQLATTERDVAVVDTGRQAQEQREELKVQLTAEVEDARISNARKLEDLQENLNRSLEAQAIKLEIELEKEAIKEQRLSEQRTLAAQRDLEQFQRSEAEKTARLQESLAVQFALIEAAKTKELAFTAQVEAQKTTIVEAEVAKRHAALASLAAAQIQAGSGALSLAPTRGDLGFARPFQRGGRPRVGEPVTVGEAGPEIFVPDTAGTIIPNSAIFSPPPQMAPLQQGAAGNNITNNSTFNLAESMFNDPIARRQLTNFVLGVLSEGV